MPTEVSISHIVVIQSLPKDEPQTGFINYEWINGLVAESDLPLRVELIDLSGASDFLKTLSNLSDRARIDGDWPILHIECHGSRRIGLHFADDSWLAWDSLGSVLSQLNIATEFNLPVLVSACYGAYLSGQISPIRPAPAWCVIAPTKEINQAEILEAFRSFYSRLVATQDLGLATSALSRVQLTRGGWFWQLSEEWYEHLIVAYAKKNCTKSAIRHWARRLSYKMRAEGKSRDQRSVERELSLRCSQDLTGKYFDLFFSLAEVPANAGRFEPVRRRVEARLDTLRASGAFAL